MRKQADVASEVNALTHQVNTLTESTDNILLFRIGDYHEAFYAQAEMLSKITGETYHSRRNPPICGIRYDQLEKHLPAILKTHNVAFCESMSGYHRVSRIERKTT